MEWTPGDLWRADAALPAGGVYEYKYVLVGGGVGGRHALAWQRGNNSVLALSATDTEAEVPHGWRVSPATLACNYTCVAAGVHNLSVLGAASIPSIPTMVVRCVRRNCLTVQSAACRLWTTGRARQAQWWWRLGGQPHAKDACSPGRMRWRLPSRRRFAAPHLIGHLDLTPCGTCTACTGKLFVVPRSDAPGGSSDAIMSAALQRSELRTARMELAALQDEVAQARRARAELAQLQALRKQARSALMPYYKRCIIDAARCSLVL